MKLTLTAMTLLALVICGASATETNDTVLTNGWKFIRQHVTGAEAPGFDDAGWESISLPHTWNAQDGSDGGDNYYRGPAWYRTHIRVEPAPTGQSFFLKFDAANRNATVYLNGQKIGSHKGGCAAFCFDVSSVLKPGADNVLAVLVDNSHDPSSPPLSADFTFFGGLYRPVHLLQRNPVHISPLDYASPGVYVKQVQVTPASAELEITTKLRNALSADKNVVVRSTVHDRAGQVVRSVQTARALPARGASDIVQNVVIADPHLWNGRQDPYLYRVTVEVLDGDRVVDGSVQPLGLRFFRVDAAKGFFLNGRYLDLHGVCAHQDAGGTTAWASRPPDRERDFRLIEELGCTALRLAHYQHPGNMYDLCDKGGLVVWTEVPCVNDITLSPEFDDNAKQQLTELIKQNYNHPSICFWSVGNEMTLRTKHSPAKENWVLFEQMNALAKQLDPTRLTTLASCDKKDDHPVNFMTDVFAYNKYFGWYSGEFPQFGQWLDRFHQKFPTRPLGISEYGAGANPAQHDPQPIKRDPKGPFHPEEYQLLYHEHAWETLSARPWVWGKFIWVMFDFAVDNRNEGSQPGLNDKGLVTRDRQLKKDAFYFYKANWSQDPVVHITSRRYTPRPIRDMPIKVYSNSDSVELKINGRSLGPKTATDHIFTWPEAKLRVGENQLEAIGQRGGQTSADTVTITVSPSAK